ncbi:MULTISPECIES: hypothetical protein [Caproicibacterium]|uniref:Uncharacterized protein n=1 Tax=Caproicibacterium argilliputei TaxID=3030016 RepID=A0AA97DBF4_9FIRM|nr:hypothetical protein [Caproicibacterium argilliputei]WOC32677.1 hypothetical protein PXC00_02045 [Caproicibacterium argilliputei]
MEKLRKLAQKKVCADRYRQFYFSRYTGELQMPRACAILNSVELPAAYSLPQRAAETRKFVLLCGDFFFTRE